MQKNTFPLPAFFLRSCLLGIALFITGMTLLSLRPARADAPLTTIPTGNTPLSVAVNPVTNRIYVANFESDNVMVIDGANNATQTVNIHGASGGEVFDAANILGRAL